MDLDRDTPVAEYVDKHGRIKKYQPFPMRVTPRQAVPDHQQQPRHDQDLEPPDVAMGDAAQIDWGA